MLEIRLILFSALLVLARTAEDVSVQNVPKLTNNFNQKNRIKDLNLFDHEEQRRLVERDLGSVDSSPEESVESDEISYSSSTISTIKTPTKFYNKLRSKKRKLIKRPPALQDTIDWKCPNITNTRNLECGCDFPHILRCSGDIHGLEILAKTLRENPFSVSLLDCTLKNVSFLSDSSIFENISLHGLVISSGEIKRVHKAAFLGLSSPLQALGLPSNALLSVPWNSIAPLTSLERLDLSNNKIKVLGTTDFATLQNLNYLELSDNQISSIALRTFTNLKNLETLKLGGNRLGDYPSSLQAIRQCFNLRQLDLKANSISGPLTDDTLPVLRNLESLNLDRNLIKSIHNKALKEFPQLSTLSLQHNQIDVLQDHAFYGLALLEILDLSYNGIVAISSASLQHLPRLRILDLTHNFLRALTADLIVPLPSLKELRLAGNDISIVAKNALDGAKELTNLSLQENPLSCDCTIRSFAEWLQESKLASQDLMSATCVTPPRLEGAPLFQVPLDSLSCDMDNLELDNANIIEQLEALAKQNYSTSLKDLSEMIYLKDLHFSFDYGLILTWTVSLSQDDYTCDAIFVYKEEDINEILLDNSPIHCESKVINGQNTVSVIVPGSSELEIGQSYRFCLVLVQEKNTKSDLIVGCSNITKLQISDQMYQTDLDGNVLKKRLPSVSDISNLDRISTHSDEISNAKNDEVNINSDKMNVISHSPSNDHKYELIDHWNRSFLPGLGLGILVTSVLVLIWGAAKIRSGYRPRPTVTTCYAASERVTQLTDPDNGNRYLKLQATTSL